MQKRIDLYLTGCLKGFSRGFIQRFIRELGVEINGKLIKKTNYLVKENDKISDFVGCFNNFLNEQKKERKPVDFDKNLIIYDSETFFVINKPPFIKTESLTSGFFAVHRLDKDTSGVLVIAKNVVTQAELQKQWRERGVKKTYVALVKGILEPRQGAIEAGILRSFKDRRKMSVSLSGKSRQSFTEYKVKRYFNDCSLVYAYPRTGRTHQIRVHFSAIEHPVIGDILYGDKSLNKKFEQEFGLRRQFLHAIELKITHPATGKRITFKSPLAQDLELVLQKIT